MAKTELVRVLYMEDDAGLARLLQKKLRRDGYAVDLAPDGGSGLEMAESNPYDVLLLDHNLPVHNGLDVIRILSFHDRLPPTIMVSGTGDEKVAAKAIKLGAADYVVKDTDGGYLELLPLVIDQVLSQAHLAEQKRQAEEGFRASEERYRTLTENIPVGLYRTTAGGGGRVISANPAFAAMFGFEEVEELADQNVAEYYVDPEDRRAFIARVNAEGSVDNYEVHLKRSGGTEFWGSISARAVYGEEGELAFLDGAIRDITERKRAEDALRESEERYRALFERSLDWVYIHDFEGDFLDANAAALHGLGYTRREIRDLNFASLLSGEQVEEAREAAQEVKEIGFQRGLMEYRLRRKDGTSVDVETKGSVIYRNGEPYAIQGIARDVTARKRAAEELRRARDDLESRVHERTAELTAALGKLSESEEKYRSVVEQIQDGLAIVQDGVLKFVNRAAASRLGYEVDELLGERFELILSPRFRKKIAEYSERRLEGEDFTSFYEAEGMERDGTVFPVEVGAARIQYDGRPAVLAVVRDLTERRDQEKIVREQQWVLENVLNNMSELVYVLDPDSHDILFTNQTAAEAFGHGMTGQPCYKAVWGLEAPCHGCDVERIFGEKEEPYRREAFNEKLGRWLRVNAKAVPWLDGGQVCCAVATDISENKILEEEIVAHNRELHQTVKARTRELESKNRELESFAYSVSHDLRAPLRSIEGFSRALLEDYASHFDEEGRDYLERVVAGAVRMDRLINDLLAYSRLGRRGVEYEEVDVEEIAAAASADLAEDVKAAGAQIEVASPLPTVQGDRALLLVLMTNLLENAVKYRRAGVEPQVKISGEARGDDVVFAVADNGIGIDMKFRNKIFDIFQRLHGESEYPGTGIGLASAKKVVDAHGGRIWFESIAGRGTTFYFALPRRGRKVETEEVTP